MKKTLKIGLAWTVMAIAIVAQVVIDIICLPLLAIGCLINVKTYGKDFTEVITSWAKNIRDAVIVVKDMCNEI